MPMNVLRSRLGYVGAILALTVTVTHILDQGGLFELKHPRYIGLGYWALELAGVGAAVLLLVASRQVVGWVLAGLVALAPLLGLVATRTTGLPGARDDINNWGEPLGLISLFTEVTLIVLAVVMVAAMREHQRQ